MAEVVLTIGILVKWFGEMIQEIGESIQAFAIKLHESKE